MHLFPTPHSLASLRQLEAVHGGVLAPQNSADTANQGFLFSPSRGQALRHSREHATAYVTWSRNGQSSCDPAALVTGRGPAREGAVWGVGCPQVRQVRKEPGSGHLLTAPAMAEVTSPAPKGSLGHASLEPPRYFPIDSKTRYFRNYLHFCF